MDEEINLGEVVKRLEELKKSEEEKNKTADDIIDEAIRRKEIEEQENAILGLYKKDNKLDYFDQSVRGGVAEDGSSTIYSYDEKPVPFPMPFPMPINNDSRNYIDNKDSYMTYDGKRMNSLENAKAYNDLFEQLKNDNNHKRHL